MANEATLVIQLSIRKADSSGNIQLEYRSTPTSFRMDVTGVIGPAPSAILISTAGVTVDFGDITVPGLCWFGNLGDDYPFDIGIWDPDNSKFFPLVVVHPHRFWTLELSPRLNDEYGTGTGTTGAASNRLRVKAVGGSTYGRIDAFQT